MTSDVPADLGASTIAELYAIAEKRETTATTSRGFGFSR